MDADITPYLDIRTAAPTSWSSDGRRLLISSDLPGTHQVHRLDLTAGVQLPVAAEDLVPVTAFEDPIGAGYLPSSDGAADRLLLATDRGGNERTQLFTTTDDPAVAITGPDDLDPLVTDDRFIHRPGGVTRDGRLLAYSTNRGDSVAFDTWIRDLRTGEERLVYATGGWTGPAGFSPDGRYLAVSEMTTKAGDNEVCLIDIEALPVGQTADHGHPAVVELAPHQESAGVGAPCWLPDGSAFFFSTDVGCEFSGIARGTPDGSWEMVIETGWPTGCAIDWAGRHLLISWNDDGISRAELRDPVTLEVTSAVPHPGEGVASNHAFTKDGRYLAFSFSSPLHPGDSWLFDTEAGELTRLTVSPCPVDPATFVGAQLVHIDSFDGLKVPAFVFRPTAPSSDGAQHEGALSPHPVVVMIHGGPESQYRPSFSAVTQYLVAQGFAVVAPNVRGSTGYGRRYQHLDDVGLRLDSVADLAALHDWLATQPDLDEGRAALYGGSYGGYMVLAGLALQPDRWAAGVDIVGMSDLVTFLQNTSAWRRAFREREYGSLEHDLDVLRAASPINHVAKMRAPLFIVHGANDPRVPLSEAQQIHEVLVEQGVRCELRVYDDEGHGLSKLANRIDCYPQIAAFLRDVLRP